MTQTCFNPSGCCYHTNPHAPNSSQEGNLVTSIYVKEGFGSAQSEDLTSTTSCHKEQASCHKEQASWDEEGLKWGS